VVLSSEVTGAVSSSRNTRYASGLQRGLSEGRMKYDQ